MITIKPSPFLDNNKNLNINPLGPLFDRPELDVNKFKNFLSEFDEPEILKGKEVCKITSAKRSYFVIHGTTDFIGDKHMKEMQKDKSRHGGHIYVNSDGKIIEIWPFTEKYVWGTKRESREGLKRQMFHVELNYQDNLSKEERLGVAPILDCENNLILGFKGGRYYMIPPEEFNLRGGEGPILDCKDNLILGFKKGRYYPVTLDLSGRPTNEQYYTLADLYIEASNIENCWPIIVPHIEVDRGINDGHDDPTNFDYNYFYSVLETKDVPINSIEKFDHYRYWGSPNFKKPWDTDDQSWPPTLEGHPHKKKKKSKERNNS